MSFAAQPTNAKSDSLQTAPVARGLRIWPAVLLLILLGATRLFAYAFDDLSPALYMVTFFGPLAMIALTALWWVLASRAQMLDRWLGLLLVAAAGAATLFLAHPSVQGMIFMFYSLPTAAAAFLIGVLVLAVFGRRVAAWGAVTAGVLCFGYWALVRNNEGFSGDFRTSFDWRWMPNAEERFLAELKSRKSGAAPAAEKVGEVKWGGFRGSLRDGRVTGVRLVADWAARPPKEIWRKKVGPGWSSFARAGNRLYTQEQRGDAEAVICLAADTGAEVWVYEYRERFWEVVGGAGPRATPTLLGDMLFSLGANGILCRLDAATGAVAWTRDLREDAGRQPPMWGFASSPLVLNGRVIVHAGGEADKGILAFDMQTGAPVWGAPAGDHSYSSPHFATVAGQPTLLMLTNTGLHAYDPSSGRKFWDHEWPYEGYRVVQPLVVGEASVLVGTGPGAGTRRLDLRPDGASIVHERWTTQAMKPGFNDYVAHKGHLFGFDNNVFACVDLETGQKKWKEGRYGNGQVLLLPDGDQLLVISEKGELVLLRANPDKHEELTRHPALTGKTWNHPILVGNRLYARNGEEAVCMELALATAE